MVQGTDTDLCSRAHHRWTSIVRLTIWLMASSFNTESLQIKISSNRSSERKRELRSRQHARAVSSVLPPQTWCGQGAKQGTELDVTTPPTCEQVCHRHAHNTSSKCAAPVTTHSRRSGWHRTARAQRRADPIRPVIAYPAGAGARPRTDPQGTRGCRAAAPPHPRGRCCRRRPCGSTAFEAGQGSDRGGVGAHNGSALPRTARQGRRCKRTEVAEGRWGRAAASEKPCTRTEVAEVLVGACCCLRKWDCCHRVLFLQRAPVSI